MTLQGDKRKKKNDELLNFPSADYDSDESVDKYNSETFGEASAVIKCSSNLWEKRPIQASGYSKNSEDALVHGTDTNTTLSSKNVQYPTLVPSHCIDINLVSSGSFDALPEEFRPNNSFENLIQVEVKAKCPIPEPYFKKQELKNKNITTRECSQKSTDNMKQNSKDDLYCVKISSKELENEKFISSKQKNIHKKLDQYSSQATNFGTNASEKRNRSRKSRATRKTFPEVSVSSVGVLLKEDQTTEYENRNGYYSIKWASKFTSNTNSNHSGNNVINTNLNNEKPKNFQKQIEKQSLILKSKEDKTVEVHFENKLEQNIVWKNNLCKLTSEEYKKSLKIKKRNNYYNSNRNLPDMLKANFNEPIDSSIYSFNSNSKKNKELFYPCNKTGSMADNARYFPSNFTPIQQKRRDTEVKNKNIGPFNSTSYEYKFNKVKKIGDTLHLVKTEVKSSFKKTSENAKSFENTGAIPKQTNASNGLYSFKKTESTFVIPASVVNKVELHEEINVEKLIIAPLKNIENNFPLLIEYGQDLSALIVRCYLEADSLLSLYTEWTKNRQKTLLLFEEMEKNISKLPKASNFHGVVKAIEYSAKMAEHFPDPRVSIAGKIISIITGIVSRVIENSSFSTGKNENTFDVMHSLRHDNELTSSIYLNAFQCSQIFEDACQFSERFHNAIVLEHFEEESETFKSQFFNMLIDFNPRHHVVYFKRLRRCFESMASKRQTDKVMRAFTNVFEDWPKAISVIDLLYWRFCTNCVTSDSLEKSWEEIYGTLKTEDSLLTNNLLQKIQDCIRVLIKENNFMGRALKELQCLNKIK